MTILILRPQPGADATARRARALGLDAIAAPLFHIEPLAWDAPDPAAYDAVLMTSANAARFGGEALSRYHHLPLFAVGSATEAAARAAGFPEILAGEGDGAAILDRAVAQGKSRLLHLVGRDHVDFRHPRALVDRRIVYASEAVQHLPLPARQAIEDGTIALLHSARAARLLAELIDREALDRSRVAIVAISDTARAAAGAGWLRSLAAPVPDNDALLAIAARLCDQDVYQDREDQP